MSEIKIQQIRDKTIETLKNYFIEDAQELITEIEELKRNPEVSSNSAMIEELNVYMALLKFVAFSTLPEPEQLELFESFILKAVRVGIDIKNRFAIKMNLTPDILWPETAQMFVESLLKNDEKLGNQQILVRGEKEESTPELRNWLRDYNRIYGMDRHEKIIPHRYITESQNIQKLSRDDQVILLKILEFYEGLKFPSQSQIQNALEKALDQYVEQNEDFPDETNQSESEAVLDNVRERLQINSNDYLDNDIENLINKFPKVTDQPISREPIKLLFNDETVKPTVTNWLADYRAYAGVGNHEVNERSDYLLRSPNVQNLTPEERERLGLLLRSYDEHYPLPFSVSRQEILFDRVKTPINS